MIDTLLDQIREKNLSIAVDSRKVEPHGIFVLLNEAHADEYLADAARRGADYAVVPEGVSVPDKIGNMSVIRSDSSKNAARINAAKLSATKYDTQSIDFPIIGVTGTNGKTTTTYLLEYLFNSCGRSAGVIGTVATRWAGHDENSSMTTPDAPDLHHIFAQMRKDGVNVIAMEVSSHALDQDRVACIPFDGAVFTNLTQDHLDYHKTFEAYFNAKVRLFLELPKPQKAMSIGVDNEWGIKLVQKVVDTYHQCPRLVSFGLKPFTPLPHSGAKHLFGRILSSTTKGLHLSMSLSDENGICDTWEIQSSLVGAFNAENLLAVQAIALGLGFMPKDFQCFSQFSGVPGRLERIENPLGLDIFVDYAHTPDALTNVLSALRGAGFKRIVCVFGCGGDRDRTKRPLMAQAVEQGAELSVLTSDNPRHEDPNVIIADALIGFSNPKKCVVEPDRRSAIAHAISLIQKGDALLVAGKGHERTQQIGDIKYPFSDQETIRELCR